MAEHRFVLGWRVAKPHLRRYAGVFMLGFLLLGATNGLQVAIPWLLKIGVDALPGLAEGTGDAGVLGWVALGIAAAALAQGATRIGSRWFLFRAGRDIEYDIRGAAYAKLLGLDSAWYRASTRGDLVSRVSNDISNVRLLFGFGLLNVVNTVVAYVAAFAVMLSINPLLTGLAVLPLPLMFAYLRGYGGRLHGRFLDAQQSLGQLSGYLQETLQSIEDVFVERFLARNDANYRANMRLAWTRSVMAPLSVFIGGFGVFIVLGAGGWMVIEQQITIGEFVAFQGYLGMLVWPTLALGWLFNVLERGLASLIRVQEIMDAEPAIADPPAAVAHVPQGRVTVRGLRVEAGGEDGAQPFRLGGFDLDLEPGRRVALVGRTGSGKSSVLRAMLRLSEVDPGMVAYDGHDVRSLRLATLRAGIGYLPQEPFLIGGSIRKALTAGHADVGDDDAWRALDEAALGDEVRAMPQGLDTRLGERGVTLSGGQRQRLALARLLLGTPRVLILDDPLSALDFETGDRVRETITRVGEGRSILWATHRLQQMDWFHEIILLRDGQVAARGRHAELMGDDEYRRLVERQQLLRRLEAQT
jgi:ATP-binding cassette subfamily B protein